MTPRGRRRNRIFTDMQQLRATVDDLIRAGRYRITRHPREVHPEFEDYERVAVVQWGTRDQPDRGRPPEHGVYVCWTRHPSHGNCRGVYAVEETAAGDLLVIISVMPE